MIEQDIEKIRILRVSQTALALRKRQKCHDAEIYEPNTTNHTRD